MGQGNHPHQAVGDMSNIFVEPAAAYDLKKDIYEQRVHAYDGKKLQVFMVLTDIDPPVNEGQAQQAPAQGSQGE